MIVLKCRASCIYAKYLYLRGVCRLCSKAVTDVRDSELLSTADNARKLDTDALIEKLKTKIMYSTVLHRHHLLSWKATRKLIRKQADEARRERHKLLKEHLYPIAMKYTEEFSLANENTNDNSEVNTLALQLAVDGNAELVPGDVVGAEAQESGIIEAESTVPATLTDNDSLESQDEKELVSKSYFKRNISCGGCGAIIQCEHQYNPGFIPLEFLSSLNSRQQSLLLCQRCYFTRSLKVSMQVNFNPFSYLKGLNMLKRKRSLILAVFDVSDISHSICSSISEFVGKGHPVILVGNKVDLLPPDRCGYMSRVRDQIKEIFKSNGHLNIKDVILVSSMSGTGIEHLITKLFSIWENYGDVILVGHTNAGKSSLFNALLNSDFCKATRSADIQTATTSPWPGTTLGLLKFPITRPAGAFMYQRTKRLQLEQMEKKLAAKEEASSKKHVGFLASPDIFAGNNLEDIDCETGNNAVNRTIISISQEKLRQLGMSISRLKDDDVKWCHDIPGIPHSERTLDFLTPDEMRYAVPGPGIIIPRTFYVKVGISLFIGGLARLDHNTGDHPIWVTVFASSKLPVLVCATENAGELYASLLGTHVLGVPRGGSGRLEHWPPLASKEFEVIGLGKKESCADVLLSSAGWTAITAVRGAVCGLCAHTPRGLGIDLRIPSLMPYSVHQKGPRRENSPAYPAVKEHVFSKYA